jgi:enoyl-CoA hydratase/carnithine racemase
MMADGPVLYEARDGVAVITLNRPEKRNAINQDMAVALREAWQRFEAGAERAAILTHAGEHFTGGADVRNPPEDFPACVPNVGVMLSKPVVAALSGWAVGGGVVIVQMCELCVADESARFMFPEAKVGFTGALIAGLAARIPHKVAMELMLLGDPVTAQRMYEVGFVNRIAPPGAHVEVATDYARRLADNAPLVMQLLRDFVGQVIPRGPSEQSAIGRHAIARVRQSEDAQEGRASFREKRTPRFKGR